MEFFRACYHRGCRSGLVIGTSIVLGMLCLTLTQAQVIESERKWHFLVQDTAYAVRYYDPELVTNGTTASLKVWTKTEPTKEGNLLIKEIDSLWEIDCQRKAFRNFLTRVFYKDGREVEDKSVFEWSEAGRGIWIQKLLESVCLSQ